MKSETNMAEAEKKKSRLFYSRGKLLLTGEYAVLRGATALAFPLNVGQYLEVSEGNEDDTLVWKSFSPAGKWFDARISLPELRIISTSSIQIADTLCELLRTAQQIRSDFLAQERSLSVRSNLEFLPEWGLGSSSSLVSNVADWAKCDPFELNRRVFHGSGYDVACARSLPPILYRIRNRLPDIRQVTYKPAFAQNMWMVYLNAKKSSKHAVQEFNERNVPQETLDRISAISEEIMVASDWKVFCALINEHEQLVGQITGQLPVKKRLFPDFDGCVKSLGAWGGDFVVAVSKQSEDEVRKWFEERGYETVLPFNEMIAHE